MKRTLEQFEAEMAAARASLESQGKSIGARSLGPSDESELKSDYDLPYSTLPKIRSKKWIQTETLPEIKFA